MLNTEMQKRYNLEIKERFAYLRDTLLSTDIFVDELNASTLRDKFSAIKPLLNTFEKELTDDLNGPFCEESEARRTIRTLRRFESVIRKIFHANTSFNRNRELDSFFNFVRHAYFTQMTKTITVGVSLALAIITFSAFYAIFAAQFASGVLTAGFVIAAVIAPLSAYFTYRFSENTFETRGRALKLKLKEIVADLSLDSYIVKREIFLAKYFKNAQEAKDHSAPAKMTEKAAEGGFIANLFGVTKETKVETAPHPKSATTVTTASSFFGKLGVKTQEPVTPSRVGMRKE